MNFTDKKVSVQKAITILAKDDIQVDDQEAFIILDFLYLMAKSYNKPAEEKSTGTQRRSRTSLKHRKNIVKTAFSDGFTRWFKDFGCKKSNYN